MKNKHIFKEINENNVEKNWFKMLWIKIFGKTVYGLDVTSESEALITAKIYKGQTYIVDQQIKILKEKDNEKNR